MNRLSVLIKPASSNCDIDCNYCFYKDVENSRTYKHDKEMSLDCLEKLIEKVFLFADGSATFIFQGGRTCFSWFIFL